MSITTDAARLAAQGPLAKYDTNKDGVLDAEEMRVLVHDVDSIHTPARYAAYVARAARVVRYLAYTSDVGEAFRPVAHPWVVKGAYGVSWAYVAGDIAYTSNDDWKQGARGELLYQRAVKRTVFQVTASIALPAVVIHAAVAQSKRHVFSRFAAGSKARLFGPTVAGLGVIPFLPYALDHPVETAVDTLFDAVWPVEAKVPVNKHH